MENEFDVLLRDAFQLLDVAYLWKVPVDEQWRLSYADLRTRYDAALRLPAASTEPLREPEAKDDAKALNAIYAIATRTLAESSGDDTGALVEICGICEGENPAPEPPAQPADCLCSSWVGKPNPKCPVHSPAQKEQEK